MTHTVQNSPLGQQSIYKSSYDARLLYPIPRQQSRNRVPFVHHGVDIWNCYELSWLNPKGKPVVALAEFIFPADSENLIESKSFKLYLNSFNQTVFESRASVIECLQCDLGKTAGAPIQVTLTDLENQGHQHAYEIHTPQGLCLDHMDIAIAQYDHPEHAQLKALNAPGTKETLYSHLLKSNCPVTGQPDWGSVFISYKADVKLDQAALLQYIISYRQHADFHEHCVEQIFTDIYALLQPQELEVYARYVRRGGLDINPYRSTRKLNYHNLRLVRQ